MPEKNKDKFVIKYVGDHESVVVTGFYDGNGFFAKKGSQHTLHDPDEIALAKKLVAENENFEEVSK